MTRIVTTSYRYKRPPRKRKAAPLAGPAVVTPKRNVLSPSHDNSRAEALTEPFRAFPSWFLRITCDRCGKDRMISETHAAQGGMLIRDILLRIRHDGCGGRPGQAELLTGIESASSRPARRIVLLS